jgi:hypothetical protein
MLEKFASKILLTPLANPCLVLTYGRLREEEMMLGED